MNLNITYSVWKTVVQNNSWLIYHYVDGSNTRRVWSGDRDHVYESFVSDECYADWDANFGTASTEVQRPDDAVALIVGLVNVRPEPLSVAQSDGIILSAESPRVGSEIVIGTHNFCDPTTWFGDSVRVDAEALTDSGDGLVWNSAHVNWIDMRTGRMHNQEHWRELVDHQYAVEVKVDGTTMTHCAPFDFTSSTGDYWVDYDEGKIHFFVSQAGKAVTASYSYENGSVFYVRPTAGKVLRIEDAEADFSKDSVLTTCFGYIVLGWADVFAPDMVPDPLPSGTLVPLQTDYYLRVGQIVTEARGALPPIDAIGATAEELLITDIKEFRRKSRGMKNSVQAIPFNYATARDLHSAYGMELHVKTNDGKQVQGEHMTITFYCTSKD